MIDKLGDRMKAFEGQESDRRFLPMLPICVRYKEDFVRLVREYIYT